MDSLYICIYKLYNYVYVYIYIYIYKLTRKYRVPIILDFLRPNRDLLRKCNADLPAGNRTRDPENLVRCSANWATEAVAESMATSSLFYEVGSPIFFGEEII